MNLEQKIEKLPPYIYCDDPDCHYERHYLTFNKDIQGKWTVGYIEFEHYSGILTGNNYPTLEAAVEALASELHVAFS